MESKPLAVVTGASSGIGMRLAEVFADNGFDLVIAAKDDLGVASTRLSSMGADVTGVQVDLATHEGNEDLARRIAEGGRPIDALALNAGRGAGGSFVGGPKETLLSDELEVIDLNCRGTVHLAKLLLPGMVQRGEGRVLVTSSIASEVPGAFQAVYNASKSFTQSFGLALREELADSGVTVTNLMPGPTDTAFFDAADMEQDTAVGAGPKDDARDVAEQAFKGLMAGDERVLGGGLKTKVQDLAATVTPDRVKAKLHRKVAEPGSA